MKSKVKSAMVYQRGEKMINDWLTIPLDVSSGFCKNLSVSENAKQNSFFTV